MKKTILFSAAILAVLISCKKQGCTDIDATNYDADAKKDNGACSFEGSTIFWYGEETSDFLVSDAAVALTYYVDNQIVGSSSTGVYWEGSAPDCGTNGLITVTKDLGNVKTQAYSYKVTDQSGWIYWSGTLNFNANTCFSQELN